MNTPVKTLVFAGSTRAQSLNRRLAAVVADMAQADAASVSRLELADFDLPLYNADLQARGTPHDVIRLKEIFHAHAAWLICAPEYNGSYPALLKNTIDWVSSPIAGDPLWSSAEKAFAGKVVGLFSASPGALGGLRGLSHLAPLLLNLQCWITPRQFSLARADLAFDAAGTLALAADRAGAHAVVQQTLWAARILAPAAI
ncbi:NAD(P)H-dependent oxidoreductase [Hydrogenophaga sp.]|uniref:NADPH-dependent FMN reductase n=1 Tax=Hydrogenophaga sp. TaxID=1904254 RepID=UPI0019B24097|nr:NAD(P)H-dependent oxidoreductase [Hydrogenophaga sp.]MBD3894118.1 NADPH-dependent oxidoreductase [Hydrogenophaga sp.]